MGEPRTDITESTSALRLSDANTHIAYVGQQQLDGYDAMVRHAIKRKAVFDKRILARSPREVIFEVGQLIQFFHSSVHNTLEAKRKRLETLEGEPVAGEFHARRLRAFVPRDGTKLAEEQKVKETGRKSKERTEEQEDEENTTQQPNNKGDEEPNEKETDSRGTGG